MALLTKRLDRWFSDLSFDLEDGREWIPGTLRTLEFHLEVSALAFDALSRLLAVGTPYGFVHIFGGPGVECKLTPQEPARIKILHFASGDSILKLLCVDDRSHLHIWDLNSPDSPKLQKTTRFDSSINSLTVSPSHTHAFVTLSQGEVRTYDLLCLRKSPYTIPNLWSLYEKKLVTAGMVAEVNRASQIPVDLISHPRDLNLAFIAYTGGIILSDLTLRTTVRAYEYVIPPGAPGGAGYSHPDLLTHRRPSVTAFAVHPAGHFFAVGYADGCVAFWAVEDDDQPILVRTIDEIDVHLVDGIKVEEHLSHSQSTPILEREAIFKLRWSGFPNSLDPRGGETVLTVLGGLTPGTTSGVAVFLLPPFNSPTPPPTSNSHTGLHAVVRQAIRQSLLPLKQRFYPVTGLTHDFLLMPRNNPHFCGSYDPVAILLLVEAKANTRAVEAFQFPPPSFAVTTPNIIEDAPVPEKSSNSISQECAPMLEVIEEPRQLRLPISLWAGGSGVVYSRLFKVERNTFEKFESETLDQEGGLPCTGGTAWPKDLKLSDRISRKILVTAHDDLSIRFQDISFALLSPSPPNPIRHHFPRQLPSLTIDLMSCLADSSIMLRHSSPIPNNLSVASVHFTAESLDCTIALTAGQLIVYRMNEKQQLEHNLPRETEDKELIILDHIPQAQSIRFHPYFMFAPQRGPLMAYETSDIGFLAASYADGSLFIVDLRGPTVILRCEASESKKRRPGILSGLHGDVVDPATSLSWSVCCLSSDRRLMVRLIAARVSGNTHVFSLVRPGSTWIVEKDPVSFNALASPLPGSSFVLDSKKGLRWKADRKQLALSIRDTVVDERTHCFWVIASVKGARCFANVNGDRLGKADWGNKMGMVNHVEIVERSDSVVLVAFTDGQEVAVYSLPHLERLHVLSLPSKSDGPVPTDLSGELLLARRHTSGLLCSLTLASLFAPTTTETTMEAYARPTLDLGSARPVNVPPYPVPVGLGPQGMLSSWLGMVGFGAGKMTGEQLDNLLAGPDRPLPEVLPMPAEMAETTRSAADLAAAASATGSNLYARLNSALAQRGEALTDLNARLDSLGEGSRTLAAQAKKYATEQTAKSWFKFS